MRLMLWIAALTALRQVAVACGKSGTTSRVSGARLTIREGNSLLWQKNALRKGIPGITSATADTGYIIVEAGSGVYHFNVRCSP